MSVPSLIHTVSQVKQLQYLLPTLGITRISAGSLRRLLVAVFRFVRLPLAPDTKHARNKAETTPKVLCVVVKAVL